VLEFFLTTFFPIAESSPWTNCVVPFFLPLISFSLEPPRSSPPTSPWRWDPLSGAESSTISCAASVGYFQSSCFHPFFSPLRICLGRVVGSFPVVCSFRQCFCISACELLARVSLFRELWNVSFMREFLYCLLFLFKSVADPPQASSQGDSSFFFRFTFRCFSACRMPPDRALPPSLVDFEILQPLGRTLPSPLLRFRPTLTFRCHHNTNPMFSVDLPGGPVTSLIPFRSLSSPRPVTRFDA